MLAHWARSLLCLKFSSCIYASKNVVVSAFCQLCTWVAVASYAQKGKRTKASMSSPCSLTHVTENLIKIWLKSSLTPCWCFSKLSILMKPRKHFLLKSYRERGITSLEEITWQDVYGFFCSCFPLISLWNVCRWSSVAALPVPLLLNSNWHGQGRPGEAVGGLSSLAAILAAIPADGHRATQSFLVC